MKTLKQKSFTHKIIIAIVFVILFNFISPQISYGSYATFGGILFEPIQSFTLMLGDAAINVIQQIIFGTDISIIKISVTETFTENLLTYLGQVFSNMAVTNSGGFVSAEDAQATIDAASQLATTFSELGNTVNLPLYYISPEEIFSNSIALFDVNFFNPGASYEYSVDTTVSGDDSNVQVSSAAILQSTISSWYYTIRNFVIIAMLSILLYMGIKIIISSNNSQERAKYKQRIADWLIGLCLIFFLHYIMAFAVTITELITEAVSGTMTDIVLEVGSIEELADKGYAWSTTGEIVDEDGEDSQYTILKDLGWIVDDGDGETLYWYTNLMGVARYKACLIVDGSEDGDNTLASQFGYTIIFLALVGYTIVFIFRYIKRLLMLAFLTIIAPFVAMTYPIDKMKDNAAQGFNTWLKEYVYNLLIQPVHLILYYICIDSAIELATNNLIYSLVALGFIFEAEKIMRMLFGFKNANTVASGTALGGAMAMQGLNALGRIAKGASNKLHGKEEKKESGKIRTANKADQNSSITDEETGRKSLSDLSMFKNKNNATTSHSEDSQNNNDENTNEIPNLSDNNSANEIPNLLDNNSANEPQNEQNNESMFEKYDNYDPKLMNGWDYGTNEDGSTKTYDDFKMESGEAQSKYYSEMKDKNINPGGVEIDEDTRQTINRGLFNPHTQEYDLGYDPALDSDYNPNANEHQKFWNEYSKRKNEKENEKENEKATKKEKRKETIKGYAQNVGDAAKGVAAVAGKGVKYVAPKAARAAVTGVVAGTGAMIGISAGLVSDDYSNVAKYGAAGLAAGAAIGNGGVNAAIGTARGGRNLIQNGKETIASTYTYAAHGAAAEAERQQKRADEAAKKDQTRRSLYERELRLKGEADIDKVMEQAQKYRDYGITNDSIIIKAMGSSSEALEGKARDSDERILTAGLATQVGKDSKKLDTARKDLKTKIKDDKEVDKYIEAIREVSGQKMV